ncbi:hypothetical protein [Bacillus mycoides]|uniref:hypothetical protein n=1 Tax=Bacillus mycoides TaxID=1405 RepID=UPI002930B63A|nr:hypothetical protein [Bacillus mycoides]WOA61051.1 hypothetical protein RVY74_31880 [Bacillus mycoides]
MEKWPAERIAAVKRNVEGNNNKTEELERLYIQQQSALRGTIERIQRINNETLKHKGELYFQGWILEENRWVEVDDE